MNYTTNTPQDATEKALHKPAPVVIVPVETLSADCRKYGIEDNSSNRKRIRRGYAIFESAFSSTPHITRNGPNEAGNPTFTVTSQNPDQSGTEKYTVTLATPRDAHAHTCTCKDMTEPPHAEQCKHITAALLLDEYDADCAMIAEYEATFGDGETGPDGFGTCPHDHTQGFGL